MGNRDCSSKHMVLFALSRKQQISMRRVPTFTPATLAGGKLSLSALVNAFSSTRLQADSLK